MKRIVLLGPIDKRILIYPLARALSIEHNVIVIADDGVYRRLYQGTERYGTCGKVDIAVGVDINSVLSDAPNYFGVQHNFQLIASNNEVPAKTDYVINCLGVDRTICPENNTPEIKDIPFKNVVLSYKVPKDKNKIAVTIGMEAVKYLFDVEEQRQLKVLPIKNINKVIAKTFGEATGLGENHLYKLLNKKGLYWGKSKK